MPYNNGYINANGNGSCFGMEERTYLVFVWLRWYWENAKEYPKNIGDCGCLKNVIFLASRFTFAIFAITE